MLTVKWSLNKSDYHLLSYFFVLVVRFRLKLLISIKEGLSNRWSINNLADEGACNIPFRKCPALI